MIKQSAFIQLRGYSQSKQNATVTVHPFENQIVWSVSKKNIEEHIRISSNENNDLLSHKKKQLTKNNDDRHKTKTTAMRKKLRFISLTFFELLLPFDIS